MISYFFMIFLVLLVPSILIYIMIQPLKTLNNKYFMLKWGKAYEGINIKNKANLFFRIWFCIRRIIFISSLYLIPQYISLQLICFMYANLFSTVYQGNFKPLNIRFLNRLQMTNEYLIACMAYMAVLFTDLIDADSDKYYFAWHLIGIISFTFIINMIFIFALTLQKLRLVVIKYGNLAYYYGLMF